MNEPSQLRIHGTPQWLPREYLLYARRLDRFLRSRKCSQNTLLQVHSAFLFSLESVDVSSPFQHFLKFCLKSRKLTGKSALSNIIGQRDASDACYSVISDLSASASNMACSSKNTKSLSISKSSPDLLSTGKTPSPISKKVEKCDVVVKETLHRDAYPVEENPCEVMKYSSADEAIATTIEAQQEDDVLATTPTTDGLVVEEPKVPESLPVETQPLVENKSSQDAPQTKRSKRKKAVKSASSTSSQPPRKFYATADFPEGKSFGTFDDCNMFASAEFGSRADDIKPWNPKSSDPIKIWEQFQQAIKVASLCRAKIPKFFVPSQYGTFERQFHRQFGIYPHEWEYLTRTFLPNYEELRDAYVTEKKLIERRAGSGDVTGCEPVQS